MVSDKNGNLSRKGRLADEHKTPSLFYIVVWQINLGNPQIVLQNYVHDIRGPSRKVRIFLVDLCQIVVARINDEVTVKRYTQNNSIVTLLPENDEFLPIEVDLELDEMVIEGIVVGVLRSNVE